MTTRGTLYRCHLFSYGGPQTPGIEAAWTRALEPVGEEALLSGTVVELVARIDGSVMSLSPQARLRFDILEQQFILTGGLDDRVDAIVGPGAAAPEEGFRALHREVEYVPLGRNESLGDHLDLLRRREAPDYRERLILAEQAMGEGDEEVRVFSVVAFWTAQWREDFRNAEFYFIVNVDDAAEDTSEEVLNVRREAVPRPAVRAEALRAEEEVAGDLILAREALEDVLADFAREQAILDEGVTLPGGASGAEEGEAETQARRAARARVATPLPLPEAIRRALGSQAQPRAPVAAEEEEAVVPSAPRRPAARAGRAAAGEAAPASAEAGAAREETPWRHPAAGVADRSVAGDSPFVNNLVAIFPPWNAVHVSRGRHAESGDLIRAIYWGWLLFGARSFVVVEGPIAGEGTAKYFTVPLDHRFPLMRMGPGAEPGAAGGAPSAGLRMVGVAVRYWQLEQKDAAGNSYVVRCIGTTDSSLILPNFRIHVTESRRQLLAGAGRLDGLDEDGEVGAFEDWIPLSIEDATARPAAFAVVDAAVARRDGDAAVRALVELNHHAFRLLTSEERAAHLRRLLGALTVGQRILGTERIEDTIVEIIRTARSQAELATLFGALGRDEIRRIVSRMDERLWRMLVDIGRRFGEAHPLTIDSDFLIELFVAGFGGNSLIPPGVRNRIGRNGDITISTDAIDQLSAAANGFLRFGRGFLAGLWTLVSEPDKVAEGLWALVKAAVMMELARVGWPPAVQYVATQVVPIFQRALNSIVLGYKGVLVMRAALGAEGPQFVADLLERIKWAIVWEVASMFVGVGEVRAAARIVIRGVDEAAATVRLARATGRAAAQLDEFAQLAARSGVVEAGRARQILSHLPEEDIVALHRAVSGADVAGARNVDQLAGRLAGEGRAAVERATGRMRALQIIEARFPGTLARDGGDAFRRLASMPGATDEALATLARGTRRSGAPLRPPQPAEVREMSQLLEAARRLTDPSAVPGTATLDIARQVAARRIAYQHLVDETPELFTRMLQHSGGDVALLERNFDALGLMRRQAADDAARAAVARRVAAGEQAALRELTNARRALNVMKGRCFF